MNKGHGRIEQRMLTVSRQRKDFLDWSLYEQVFKLERRFIFSKTGKGQEQVVYGINSLTRAEVSPHQLLQMTCSYWALRMACLHNLILSLLIGKLKYRYLPSARHFLLLSLIGLLLSLLDFKQALEPQNKMLVTKSIIL